MYNFFILFNKYLDSFLTQIFIFVNNNFNKGTKKKKNENITYFYQEYVDWNVPNFLNDISDVNILYHGIEYFFSIYNYYSY